MNIYSAIWLVVGLCNLVVGIIWIGRGEITAGMLSLLVAFSAWLLCGVTLKRN
jgi:uncharacterized membrane protein YozB (DUF420 family)